MNRIGLKDASKQCLNDTDTSPIKVTLVYFLIIWLINLTESFVSKNTFLDYNLLTHLTEYDLMDLFEYGYLGVSGAKSTMAGVVSILCSLVISVLAAGYGLYCLRLSRRNAKGLEDVTEVLSYCGKIIWLSILIGVFTFLWSLLFIIPGIIAAYRYRMAYFALVDDPSLTARQALDVSKRITQGHKAELFVLDLSFIGWHLLCSLTLGILYIWKMPYIQTTYAHAYNWMMGLQQGGYSAPDQDGQYRGPDVE